MKEQRFERGDLVRKKKKGTRGQWHGSICGEYSTEVTPEGYAVESIYEKGSVQIYPANALELHNPFTEVQPTDKECARALRWFNKANWDYSTSEVITILKALTKKD